MLEAGRHAPVAEIDGREGTAPTRRRPSRWTVPAAVGLVIALLWSPVVHRLVTDWRSRVLGINDYPLHLQLADAFSIVPYVNNSPHFLFHAVTAFWSSVLPSPTAAVVTVVMFIWATFVAVAVLMEQSGVDGAALGTRTATALAAWYFLAETPALFALWSGVVPSTSPIYTVHWWGNPTWLAAFPFVVITIPLIERALAEPDRERWSGWATALVVVTTVGAIAKPALAIPLIVGVPAYAFLVRRLPAATAWRLIGATSAPAAVVVAWQTWFLSTSSASRFGSGVTFKFIVDAPFGWSNVGLVWALPVLLPLAAMLIAGRAYWREPAVQLVLTLLAVAVPVMLFVTERGGRSSDGNLAVPTQACMALWILVSVRVAAQHIDRALRAGGMRALRPSMWVGLAVAVAFSAGGVLSYLHALDVADVPVDWVLAISGGAGS